MTSSLSRMLASGGIRYSQVWEDHALVVDALAIKPDDDVLSIASGGCNVLAMLAQRPRSILAVDLNPAQVALVELKLRALEVLSFDEFRCLFGLAESPHRLALYDGLRDRLSTLARDWWDDHRGVLEQGVHWSGRLETFFRGFYEDILPTVHPREVVERMLSMDDLDQQSRYFDETFGTPALERAFRAYFTKERLAAEGRDPRQMRFVDELDIGEYFWRRLRWVLTALPTRTNPYVQSLLLGRYLHEDSVPPYLRRGEYEALRELVPRVRIEIGGVQQALTSAAAGTYSKANLSDLFEYLSDEDSAALFGALGERLRAQGRVCYWNLFVPRSPGPDAASPLRSLEGLASALHARDRSWFYRAFHVEEVHSR